MLDPRTFGRMASSQGEIKPADQIQLSLPTQVVLGWLLTAVAGFVDAIGYIGLGGLFASFMSGASVSLGVGLGDCDWEPVLQGTMMIASFLGGVTVATILAGCMGAWRLSAVLLLEAFLLAAAVALINLGWEISTAVLPVVAAMGVQNTVLQTVSGVRLGVTFITGTLVSLGRMLGQVFLGRTEIWRLAGHVLLWGALVTGAVAGATLHAAFGPMALAVPATLVVSLAILSAARQVRRNSIAKTRFGKGKGLDGGGRRVGDLVPNHPSVWPYY